MPDGTANADVTVTSTHNRLGFDRETFDKHCALIGRAEAEMAVAREKLKKARKAAKADGIMLKRFDAIRHLADLPRAEQELQLLHDQAYLQWLRAPVGHQFALSLDGAGDAYDDESDEDVEARTVEDAKGAGWRAGLKGEVWEKDCPHDANTAAGQAWIEAYREGQQKATKALAEGKAGEDAADAKPAKKGRGKK